MITLYLCLAIMLVSAIALLTFPFKKSISFNDKKYFGLAASFVTIFAVGLYILTGRMDVFRQWQMHGKQHYQLMIQYNQFGGINGIIARIEKKLAENPEDKQGWLILAKLYRARGDTAAADSAAQKAKIILPSGVPFI